MIAYRDIPAINISTLKEMRKSPAHYAYRLANPREDNTGLKQGRANHTLVFEPQKWDDEYAIFDGPTRKGKAWDAFEASNEGRTILKRGEYEDCLSVRDAVLAHPFVRERMAAGVAEEVLTWTDPDTGLLCKARLDFRSTARAAILDLKGTPSVDKRLYGSMAARMGHHLQACHYKRGAAANGLGQLPFFIVAVEIEPPHDIGIFEVAEDAMYAADEEYRELMAKVKECRAANRWPGRCDVIQPLELPRWCFPEDDADPLMGLTVAQEG